MSMKYKSALGTFSGIIPFSLLDGRLFLPASLPACPLRADTRPTLFLCHGGALVQTLYHPLGRLEGGGLQITAWAFPVSWVAWVRRQGLTSPGYVAQNCRMRGRVEEQWEGKWGNTAWLTGAASVNQGKQERHRDVFNSEDKNADTYGARRGT